MKNARTIVRLLTVAAFGSALCLNGCSKTPKSTSAHKTGISLRGEIVPLGKLSRDAIPLRYRIALRVDPRSDRYTGHVEIDVRFLKQRRELFLHGQGLNVSGVTVRLKSGQTFAAHYDQVDRSGVARLIFVDPVPAGQATLIFDYDAPFGRSLDGLYKVVDRGDSYAFTQFETTSARKAFPCFDDPGFKTPFDITVIVPRGDRVVGNTPIVAAAPASHGMIDTVLQPTRPLPTYLVALAIGPLDVVDGGWLPPNRYRSKPLHIRGVTARSEGRRIAYALSLTPGIVGALENYFGIGYPFQKLDILAVPDFAAGAMENAGAITFRERLLLIDPDSPLEQKRASVAVQAHELAHQWFGDLVTPAWWDDVWLNESFATWLEYRIAGQVLPDMEFDTDTLRHGLDVMDLDELPSAREVHQPVRTADDLGNAFDAITYDKGASVLRTFENYVGPDAWQRGIHAYLTKFAHGNATAQDFVATMAASTGHPEMIAAFDDFIDRPGIPNLHVTVQCAPPTLAMSQTMYTPLGFAVTNRFWHIPICVPDGSPCKLMGGASFSVPFKGECNAAPVPNADGAGYYRVVSGSWRNQIAGAAKMDAAGQITLLGNLFAALRAGQARAADVFSAVHAIAPVARWDVLKSLDRRLLDLRQSLDRKDLPAYRGFISREFSARLNTLGLSPKPGEKPADALLRQFLVTLLVSEAHDANVIASLAARIDRSAPGAKPLPPELRAEALRSALLHDPDFADRLIQLFESTDEEDMRRDIVYAFAGSDDPAAIAKLLALATSRFRIGELRYLSEYMVDEPAARSALWSFVASHFADLVKRLSLEGMARTAVILQRACDPGAMAQTESFYRARLNAIPGAERRMHHATESIARCMAFRRAKGSEIVAALAPH